MRGRLLLIGLMLHAGLSSAEIMLVSGVNTHHVKEREWTQGHFWPIAVQVLGSSELLWDFPGFIAESNAVTVVPAKTDSLMSCDIESNKEEIVNVCSTDFYQNKAEREIDSLKALLDTSFFANAQHILDIGCGSGKTAALIAADRTMSTVVASDASKSMIQQALDQYSKQQYPNLRFIQKGLVNLGFTAQFDRVLSFDFLLTRGHEQEAIEHIQSSLKPGGQVFLTALSQSMRDDVQMVFAQLATSSRWQSILVSSPSPFYTEADYFQMFSEARLPIRHLQQSLEPTAFENREAFEAWLIPRLPSGLSLEQHKLFLSDFFNELNATGHVDSAGKICVHLSRIELIASKTRD